MQMMLRRGSQAVFCRKRLRCNACISSTKIAHTQHASKYNTQLSYVASMLITSPIECPLARQILPPTIKIGQSAVLTCTFQAAGPVSSLRLSSPEHQIYTNAYVIVPPALLNQLGYINPHYRTKLLSVVLLC